ncbi:MmgE/PrpD family protein [Sphingomonas oligophenolica]|uniref:MmgE/PrpD family protein n=1 Tax=Sphingomonas oligophenolica TaxID=301154 RepID=A0ABU9Y8T0_9SPHN
MDRRGFMSLAREAAIAGAVTAVAAPAAATGTTPLPSPDGERKDPTAPAGVTGQLATWLAGLKYDAIPKAVVERGKDIILDGLGCALVGAQLPWSRTAVNAMMTFEGAGDAFLIGWGRTIARPASVLLNGTFIQAFELDDVYPAAPVHLCSVVLPALFATAIGKKMSGKAFLAATIAGFETGPRAGLALHGGDMLTRGWHSGSVFGTHAAAAAAGVAIGLSAAQMEDALGIAGTQSGGLMAAQFGSMVKRMHHGFASRAGYTGAMLAQGGYTGIKQVFEAPYGGYLSVFGEGYAPVIAAIANGLGTKWETPAISIKPYAAMGASHGPLDAMFAIRARRPFAPKDVARVDIAMSAAAFNHGWWEAKRPMEPTGAQMFIGYAMAAAIVDGAVLPAQFAPARLDADDIWAMIGKIHARHEPAFDKSILESTVTITFTDGSKEEEHLLQSKTFATGMSRVEISAKYHLLTKGIITAERRDRIERMVMGLDELTDVRPLIEALAAPAGSTFGN